MKKLLVVLLSVLCAFTLCACSGSGDTPAASDDGTITYKLGCSGPLTGGAAEYGVAVKNAAELAVEEINALDSNVKFEFKMEDDEADAEKAANCYGVLVDWGMDVSLFTVTSGSGAAVASYYDDDQIFALTPSGSSTALAYSDSKNYAGNFQMCFTDPNQGVASADYIADNGLGTKVGIIYRSDDVYSTGVREKFLAEAAVKGLTIVSDEGFVGEDASDFSVQLQKAQDGGAEVVFLPIYYQPAAFILDQANKMNYNPVFFGIDGMDGILTMGLSNDKVEGVYLLTPFAADATDDATVHFVTAYKEKYDAVPNQFGADAYDCVYAIFQALTNIGESSDLYNDMIAQFKSMTFNGVTGTNVTWAENGEVSKAPKAVIIKDGAYTAAQ